MIKFVKISKMLIMSMMIAVMIMPAMICSAGSVTQLDKIVGNWYDSSGNMSLVIGKDYSINGCKIVKLEITGGDYGGSTYQAKILEKNGYRDIKIFITSGRDYHELIVIDNNAYRRTKNPRYYESIGGIYLGMSQNQVLALYGQPSEIDNRYDYPIWKYNKDGFNISFAGDVVDGITIYPNGSRRFDKSGLSANDSNATYEKKYNSKVEAADLCNRMIIGYGEVIYFNRDNSKTLGKYEI
ncbi:MAG: hypothetical protein IJ563_11635 [Selenomonadaceae bacterium]|nr:hypothetical protein [Selenomonadaceae bacterium]